MIVWGYVRIFVDKYYGARQAEMSEMGLERNEIETKSESVRNPASLK